MIYSHYYESENQSTKWNRVRVNYELIAKVIRYRESLCDDYQLIKQNHKKITRTKNENQFRKNLVRAKYYIRYIRVRCSNLQCSI